jgi:hypothetical protein
MRHLLRYYDSGNVLPLLSCNLDFRSLLRRHGDGIWPALRKLRPRSF